MTALVTGATGLLGGNLVRTLLAEGTAVRVVVRDVDRARRLLAGLDVEYVLGDLDDVGAWERRLRGCDAVYGCAAYFSEYYGPGRHNGPLQTRNVDAVVELARAAGRQGVGVFVHTSSIGVTGPASEDGALSDETCPPDERSLTNGYHSSKWRAEQALTSLATELGTRVPIVRPGWLFGPGDAAPTASGQLVLDVARRKLPAVPPGGNHATDARDVARVMIEAAGRGRTLTAYHAAAPWQSMEQLITTIARCAGVAPPRWRMSPSAAHLLAFATETQARLTGRRPLATREGVAALQERRRVDSRRAADELSATFRPFDETVADELNYFTRSQGSLTVEPILRTT